MKIIQVYADSLYDDEDVEKFHEDIETAVELNKIHYYFIIVDFKGKIGKKECRNDSIRKLRK